MKALSLLAALVLAVSCADGGSDDDDDDASGDGDTDSDTDADADGDGDWDAGIEDDAGAGFDCPELGEGACDVVETSAGGFFPWQLDTTGFSAGHTCARLGSGELACWGVNDSGQLGDGTERTRPDPARVAGASAALQVSSGGGHTCAVLQDAAVRCWGSNARGQLGDGTTDDSAYPLEVLELAAVQSVATGGRHTCATLLDGSLWCWGDNERGQLGDENADDGSCGVGTPCASVPFPVPALDDDVVEVALGERHSCARTARGTVFCWGANESGELGDGTLDDRATPAIVVLPTSAVHIAAGGSQTCALAEGHVRCWGAIGFDRDVDLATEDVCNNSIADPAPCVTTPGPVIEGIVDATAIAVGKEHACALVTGGRVACWGANRAGQLGAGDLGEYMTTLDDVTTFEPVEALGVSGADGVTAGRLHTCAWRAEGIWCWGDDERGQLGLDPDLASHECRSRIDTVYPCQPTPELVTGLPVQR